MTENDTTQSPTPRSAGSPEHGDAGTAPLRRRDVHRQKTAGRRAGTRRAAVPATLTALALSAGLATGVAATASGSPDTASAPSTAGAPSTGEGTPLVRTAVGGTTTTSQEVSSAQAALTRARTVADDSAALSDEQREKIARKADRLRALVTDQETATADDGAAATKASRSTERVPVADRAEAETDEPADAEQADAPADAEQADAPGAAAVAVGNAITHPTLLSETGAALTDAEATDGAGSAGTGAGGGKVAASSASSEKLASATESLTELIDKTEDSPVEIEAAPATPAEILTAQVKAAREAAPALAKHADDTRTYENGRVPTDDLCELSFAPGETLRCDAAEQLERLNTAYKAEFGKNLQIRDSYRSYDSQVSVKASRGYLAAVPGYSDHGWAIAVDLNGGVEEFGSAQHSWLQDIAPKFGWDNPDWARADGRKPEAWHWEYTSL